MSPTHTAGKRIIQGVCARRKASWGYLRIVPITIFY